MTTQSLPIEGMTCASCSGRVERALLAIDGVQSASVNLMTERAEITHDASLTAAALIDAIELAGFEVPTLTHTFAIEGMTCASCSGRVERALTALPGILSAHVNLATERATLSLAAHTLSPAEITAAIEETGFGAQLLGEEGSQGAQQRPDLSERHAQAARSSARALLLAALLSAPVFVLEMGSHMIPAMHRWVMQTLGQQTSWWIQAALTTMVLAGPGWRFFKQGVPALLARHPDMNSLVVLGTLSAYSYSLVATLAPSWLPAGSVHVYYEPAALIVTLILLGRTLEQRAKGRTGDAIGRLLGLRAKTARVERASAFVDVPIQEVVRGDLIQIRPGERVPVDGEVMEGSSFVDESMISGEPVPVEKSAGGELVAGTVNGNGSLTMRATRVGSETVLAQIIRMVEDAQGAKLPIQSVVDRVTQWFVPGVMLAALLTFVVWLVLGPQPALGHALVSAVAVLIIACPCAMGLATPTSIMVGTGRAAQMGVLFGRGEALQGLKEVKLVAFDKTGTLTQGKPALTDVMECAGRGREELLSLTAALEARSEHPIAQAIVEAAHGELPAVSELEAVPGMGLRGRVSGQRIEVGARRFMHSLGVDVEAVQARVQAWTAQGKTPVYVAADGVLAGVMAVSDPVKPSARAALDALRAEGLEVAMITGDEERTAQAIANELGIKEVVAGVMPAGKVEALERLRRAHGALAFVGDGINDAPALASADVGVAMGTGTDVAMESADVVLMSGDVRALVDAFAISRATLRNIHQNLFWAFIYNIVLIPVAAGALYPLNGTQLSPALAAGAMGLSSVFVLGNALRLRRVRSAWAAGKKAA